MPDVVDALTRSRMMSGIRGKNTRPEMIIRRALHRLGFRYRLHVAGLPGKPDMVFASRKAVIFVHGCFWHGHDCHLFKWPSTRVEFWRTKIERNRAVDRRADEALAAEGWRRGVVWECALRGRQRLPAEDVGKRCANWLVSRRSTLDVRGRR